MDQEFQICKSNSGHMQNQSFPSKNSSFTKYKNDRNQLLNYSNKSSHSMNNSGTQDILKKLGDLDNVKMCQQLSNSMRSSETKNNKSGFLNNSNPNQDKSKLGAMSFYVDEKSDEMVKNQQISHECECRIFGQNTYCPKHCICYNLPQRCSKLKCCSNCYSVKEVRLRQILEDSHKMILESNIKKQQVDVGIYIEGGKKAPKKFRQQRCQCRNSRCENKYCVCFTAGNKCTVKCLCQNCKNSEYLDKSQSSSSNLSKSQKPYLQGGGSSQSLSQKMEFDPPFLPF